MNWLELLKPNTKYITVDESRKTISLIHPHFEYGTRHFRQLLKSFKDNPYKGYAVEATGFASVKGILILEMIKRTLDKLPNISFADLKTNLYTSQYTIKVKFK